MKHYLKSTAVSAFICPSLVIGLCSAYSEAAYAQTGISAAYHTTFIPSGGNTYNTGAAPGAASSVGSNNKDYYYGNLSGSAVPRAQQLQSFQTTNSTYSYYIGQSLPLQIFVRRQTTPPANLRNVDLIFYEGTLTSGNTEVRTNYPYYPKMEDNFAHRFLGMGTDNLFTNDVNQVNNNAIERVDAIIASGYNIENAAATGFAILERGASNAHDACVVGIVTAVDANGTPTAYAPTFLRVNSSNYYTAGNIYGGNTADYFITRRNVNTNNLLQISDIVSNQGIGGVYFSFMDFNLSNHSVIYGYSIFPVDFWNTTTPANRSASAVDWTNTTVFPNNTAETNGGIDLSMVAGIVKKMIISGSVHHDGNGLTNAAVDGDGIYSPSGEQLYVYLVNPSTHNIISKVPVANDGTFEIDKITFGNLELILSTDGSGTEGGTWNSSLKKLPSGWEYAGEHFGINNGSGSGVKDGSGTGYNSPSSVKNGIVPVEIRDRDMIEVKFGIQQTPVADPKEYQVPNSAFSALYGSPGGDFPAVAGFRYIPMNAAALSGPGGNGSLSGSDAEDCPAAASCNGSGGTGATFTVTSVKNNTRLWYDFGAANGGVQQVIPNTATAIIADFDYNKMVIYGALNSGDASNPLVFNYTMTDAAGSSSAPVSYTIITAEPLPLQLTAFSGYAREQQTVLEWTTEEEKNVSHFDILRSTNGSQWATIGSVKAQSRPAANHYSFTDQHPYSGINLYKLQMTDLDKSNSYSKVIIVSHNIAAARMITAPNPFTEYISIKLQQTEQDEAISVVIYDSKGAISVADHFKGANGSTSLHLDVTHLPPGNYYLEVSTSREVYTDKLVKP